METERKDGHVAMEAETRVMWPQAWAIWGHQKPQRQLGPSQAAWGGNLAGHTRISNVWPRLKWPQYPVWVLCYQEPRPGICEVM